jgi:hydrogenase 3 maturation protease
MKNILKRIFKGRVVIVGVGNVLRSDDGFGPAFIKAIKGKVKAVCFDAGTTPENYLGKIIAEKPDTILIVDALDLGLAPGGHQILKKADIVKNGFSTHNLSPHMCIEYLENRTAADIYMLGVQPETISFGEELSASVKKTLAKLTE